MRTSNVSFLGALAILLAMEACVESGSSGEVLMAQAEQASSPVSLVREALVEEAPLRVREEPALEPQAPAPRSAASPGKAASALPRTTSPGLPGRAQAVARTPVDAEDQAPGLGKTSQDTEPGAAEAESTRRLAGYEPSLYQELDAKLRRNLAAAGQSDWQNPMSTVYYDTQLAIFASRLGYSVRELYIFGDTLGYLPQGFEKLSELRVFELVGSPATALPDVLLELPNLRKLRVVRTSISQMPQGLARLSKLEYLDLSHNRISELPDELAELPALNTLLLDDNQFEAFPEQVASMPALALLSLSQNGLEQVPATLLKAPKLRKLHLDYNRLSTLPRDFSRLPLEFLDIDQNPLDEKIVKRLERKMVGTRISFDYELD